ncbi:MAG TPA: oxygenase MpaB family protein [Edaphobacter sp.]|nr:oxygenase MpaB family protein [Edaphobacter sp.]
MMAESESRPYVSHASIEELLFELETLPGESRLGLFGPESVTWRVNRESAIFLGAGRAALLQLAHPWVAASLVHHSNLMNDAIGRFHSTFRVIYTMLFGTRAQAIAASRQLYRLGTHKSSSLQIASLLYTDISIGRQQISNARSF